MNPNSERRSLLFQVLKGSLLPISTNAIALSPRPPELELQISRSENIIVGLIERYVYRGVSKDLNPQEYGQDFNEDDEQSRAMDVIVRTQSVILKKPQTKVPTVLRIHWPIPIENRQNLIGSKYIFLLGRGHKFDLASQEVVIYKNVVPPLSIEYEIKVREIVKAHSKK